MFSNYHTLLLYLSFLLLSVVQCSQAHLEAIATNNTDVELSEPIISLTFGSTYRFCILVSSFGK